MPTLPSEITIQVSSDTTKLQKQLRAIAKHAEALAEELERIDNDVECPKCGGCEVCEMYANEKLYHASCNDCGHVIVDDLPTRFEGSE